MMLQLYRPTVDRKFAENQFLPVVPVVMTDISSAEMIKYAANVFLATKISFINEVANIWIASVQILVSCPRYRFRFADWRQVSGSWHWLGRFFFPKDVSALVHTADDYGYEAHLLKAAVEVNQRQRLIAIEKLQQVLKILKGKTVGLLGLTSSRILTICGMPRR